MIIHLFKLKRHRWMTLGLLLMTSGCSEPVANISGSASIDGNPIAKGRVVFTSENCTCAAAITDGQYELLHEGKTSVPVDDYTITVFPPKAEERYDPRKGTEELFFPVDPKLFPKEYQKTSTSKLKLSAKPGENLFSIEISSRNRP